MIFETTPFFERHEFDSPDQPGSGENMKMRFMKKLIKARINANTAFIITSGYRTKDHNKKVGGVADSAHTKGLAADVLARTSHIRYKIVRAALQAGFTRIGIAETFIHLDDDTSKTQDVIWTYSKRKKFFNLF